VREMSVISLVGFSRSLTANLNDVDKSRDLPPPPPTDSSGPVNPFDLRWQLLGCLT